VGIDCPGLWDWRQVMSAPASEWIANQSANFTARPVPMEQMNASQKSQPDGHLDDAQP